MLHASSWLLDEAKTFYLILEYSLKMERLQAMYEAYVQQWQELKQHKTV
jgi:hypothetical protein